MSSSPQSRRASRWITAGLAALVTLVTFGVGMVILSTADPNPTGDEPHYLLVAQSIAEDGDIDLANDYSSPERVGEAYPGFTELDPLTHAGQYEEGGPVVPIHSVGLPLLLVPAFELGQGWFVARATMVLLTALTAGLIFLVADRLLPRHRVATVTGVLAVMLTVPVVAFSNQIYPEVPGAFFLAASTACLVLGGRRWPTLAASALLAAYVPWIHVRFSILLVPLAAAIVLTALGLPVAGGWRGVPAQVRRSWRELAAAVAPFVVSAVALLATFWVLYGSPSPNAAYRPDVFPAELPFQPPFVWMFGLGNLIDVQRGIAPYAPVVLVCIAASVAAVLRWRWWAAGSLLAVAFFYVLTSGVAQGGGFCPPGRWFVVFMPFGALLLAAALVRLPLLWVVTAPALLFSLAVTAQLPDNYAALYPVAGDDEQRVPVARTVASVWPDIMVTRIAGIDTPAEGLRTGTGTIVAADGRLLTDGTAGTVMAGPDEIPVPGEYVVELRGRASGEPGDAVAVLQVLVGDTVVAESPMIVPEGGAGPADVRIPTSVSAEPLETRVVATGNGVAVLDRMVVSQVDPRTPSLREQANDVPTGLLWIGVVVLLGLLSAAPGASRAAAARARTAPAGPDAPARPDAPAPTGAPAASAPPVRQAPAGSAPAGAAAPVGSPRRPTEESS